MMRLYDAVVFMFALGLSLSAAGQSFEQPTPTDLEEAEKQLIKAAECELKAEPDDPATNYLISTHSGYSEHYASSNNPFKVLGVMSRKIFMYHDANNKNPDRYITYVSGSMNTVRKATNLYEPRKTQVGILDIKYSDSPGIIEIVCTVNQ